jgi:hypothetical protein
VPLIIASAACLIFSLSWVSIAVRNLPLLIWFCFARVSNTLFSRNLSSSVWSWLFSSAVSIFSRITAISPREMLLFFSLN